MSELLPYFRERAARGELSHAYLLENADGPARRELAAEVARLALCRQGDACGLCADCRALASGNHPDLIWVTHEKPDTLSVGEIRAQLVEDIGIRPYRSSRKVYIVDDAEKMNPQAQNALLKTLEEPPSYGMILLLTSNRSSFLPTVLSRCVCLKEEAVAEEAGAEEVLKLLHRTEGLRVSDMAGLSAALKAAGVGRDETYAALRFFMRDLLLVKCGGDSGLLHFPGEQELYEDWARCLGDRRLAELWAALGEAEARTRANGNPDLALELFWVKLRDALKGNL